MTLKVNVAIALFLSLFLFGSIILFGFVKTSFVSTYFFFILFLLVLIISSMRKSFENKKDIILALFLAIIFAIFLVYFASLTKVYFEKSNELIKENENILTQIKVLEQSNQGYTDYISSLNESIKIVQENSKEFQKKINSEIEKAKNTSKVITPLVVNNPPIVIYRENEEEFDD